jgi:hypothetical protein
MAITKDSVDQMVATEKQKFTELMERLQTNGPTDVETAQEILESTVRYRKFARIQRAFNSEGTNT